MRIPAEFIPGELRIAAIDDSGFSRSIIMEVLRGVGIANDHMRFDDEKRFFEIGIKTFLPDVILYIHDNSRPVEFDIVSRIRRLNDTRIAEAPIIFLSAQATLSTIEGARDNGADEFIARPVSANQLKVKLRKVIEEPQVFINSANYVGPCRRRKLKSAYDGPFRRISDSDESAEAGIAPAETSADLVSAVADLRQACGRVTFERMGLVERVRLSASGTMRLARNTDDKPLFITAKALKHYLDGVSSPNLIESHVLETGINALNQLSALPKSYASEREAISGLMKYAVRKKLAHYQNLPVESDPQLEAMMARINRPKSGKQTPAQPQPEQKTALG